MDFPSFLNPLTPSLNLVPLTPVPLPLPLIEDQLLRIKIMSKALICRLNGHRAVLQLGPTGIGPMVWQGWFVTDDGEHYLTRMPNGDPVHAVRVAPTLESLMLIMTSISATVQHKPLSAKAIQARKAKAEAKARLAQARAAYRKAHGHLEGTPPEQDHQSTL